MVHRYVTLLLLATEVPCICILIHQKLDDEWCHIPNIDIPQDIIDSNNSETFFTHKRFTKVCSENLVPTNIKRIFSMLNMIRNKMLRTVAEIAKNQGGCIKFEPTEAMIKSVKCRKNVNNEHADNVNSEDEQ